MLFGSKDCIKYGVQFYWQDVLFLQLTDVLFLQLTKSLQQFRWGNAPCYNAFSVLKTSARHCDILSRGLWMCFRKFLHFLSKIIYKIIHVCVYVHRLTKTLKLLTTLSLDLWSQSKRRTPTPAEMCTPLNGSGTSLLPKPWTRRVH